MMTPLELKRFIRFALGQLRDENAHHHFEQMCHQICKARIAENMIPATGPVGAAGDQGRDSASIPRHDGRPGLDGDYGDLSGKIVVAACTLQQDGVKKKILDDVDEICSRPQLGADVIVVFTEKNIPVGVQNELRTRVAYEHDVVLHVLDGNAIADLLAEHDLNWLAHRYLDLPAEASPTPRADEDDAWYLEQRLKWTDATPRPAWGDVEDLRQSLRHAYQHGFTADLDLWLELLSKVLDTDPSTDLRRSIIYEIAIGHLCGHCDIRPALDHLEWFFSTVTDVKPSGALEDAQVLLTFCWGSIGLGARGVPPEDVNKWRDQLIPHVDAEIDATDNPARLYTLLLVRGALEFLQIPPPPFADMRRWWDQALDRADAASLLAVNRVADRLPPLAAAYADDPDFTAFAARVDDLAVDQGGEAVAGGLARNRGYELLRAGRTTAALRELHRAKARFIFAHATSDLLYVIVLLATAYRVLGLHWAAKQHYLALASIALNSNEPEHRRYVALGLAEAAGSDFVTGGWASYLHLARIAANAHSHLDVEVGDFDEHPFLERLAYACGIVFTAATHRHTDFANDARAIAGTLLPDELIDELTTKPPRWALTEDAFIDYQERSGVRAFDEAGDVRTLTWTAHGIRWTLTSPSDLASVAATERLASTIQILQADLDDFEYAPLPCAARVEVTVVDDDGNVRESGPETFAVEVAAWTSDGDHEAYRMVSLRTFSVAVTLLRYLSTIPVYELSAEVSSRLEQGLSDRLALFRPYDELLGQWRSDTRKVTTGPLGAPPAPPEENDELPWPSQLGPGYDADAAVEALQNRYRNLTEMTQATVPRLLADGGFGATVRELRERGWLDWHILSAIHSAAASYRMNRDVQAGRRNPTDGRIKMSPEDPDDPVPLEEFDLAALEFHHDANNLSSFVKTWNRRVRLEFVPLEAVTEMLRKRYRHYDDDIDHGDPFADS